MLRALVIAPNQRTKDVGDLLAIARTAAQKREHTRQNVTVHSIIYDPVTQVYVALYRVPEVREGKV